jgi:hypothetical protein
MIFIDGKDKHLSKNAYKKRPLSIKAVFTSKCVKNGFYTEGSSRII